MAKHILTAFIEKVIQFDSEGEAEGYKHFLEAGKQEFKVMSTRTDATGKCYMTIRVQYNKNYFPC